MKIKKNNSERGILNRQTPGLIMLLAIAALIIALLNIYDISAMMDNLRQYLSYTPTFVFIALTLVLPLSGIPLTYIMILAGIKFGALFGVLLLALILPFQLVLMYYLGRYPARNGVNWLFRNTKFTLPTLPQKHHHLYAIAVVIFPGISYALKQYGLAITGIPFRIYMAVSLPLTFLLVMPFVVLGGAAMEYNPLLFGGSVAGIIALFYLVRTLTPIINRKRQAENL